MWETEWRGMKGIWPHTMGVMPFTRHQPCNRPAKRLDRGGGIRLECTECGATKQLSRDNVHMPAGKDFYVWCGLMKIELVGMGIRYVWAHNGEGV